MCKGKRDIELFSTDPEGLYNLKEYWDNYIDNTTTIVVIFSIIEETTREEARDALKQCVRVKLL